MEDTYTVQVRMNDMLFGRRNLNLREALLYIADELKADMFQAVRLVSDKTGEPILTLSKPDGSKVVVET